MKASIDLGPTPSQGTTVSVWIRSDTKKNDKKSSSSDQGKFANGRMITLSLKKDNTMNEQHIK